MSNCPHCEQPIKLPPAQWRFYPPWPCSHCGELYGVREGTDDTFKVPMRLPAFVELMDCDQAERWSFHSANQPYVYALCYPTGMPFYVGKGHFQRLIAHATLLRTGRLNPRDEKERILVALERARIKERYVILGICEMNEQALRLETMAIEFWGIRNKGGMLANLDGTRPKWPKGWAMPAPPPRPDLPVPENTWILHPKVSRRAPTHKGLMIWCPKCKAQCHYPGAIAPESGRCPQCWHYFTVDAELLYQYWLDHRHEEGPLEYPGPVPPGSSELRKIEPRTITPEEYHRLAEAERQRLAEKEAKRQRLEALMTPELHLLEMNIRHARSRT